MKYYSRTKEIAELQRIKEMAYNDHSKLTVLTGRRRIGKNLAYIKCTQRRNDRLSFCEQEKRSRFMQQLLQ